MKERLIGTGVVNWMSKERTNDRYGSIYLAHDNGNSIGNLDLDAKARVDVPVDALGAKGTLYAIVVKTRTSPHMGDLFRGIGPSTPDAGEKIVFGTGMLFTEVTEGITSFGLKPDDGREYDWMNPESFYRAVHQTVNLYFQPE